MADNVSLSSCNPLLSCSVSSGLTNTMVGYQDGSTTVLTAIPTPPPTFINISNPLAPGTYLLGHTHMVAVDIPISSFWKRSVTSSDDLILGVLSVFLIAVLSEITSSILLRTRHSTITTGAIRAAYALDQFSHFRPIRPTFSKSRHRCSHLFVLIIALTVLAVEVVFVLLTQQASASSTKYQYNLTGVQPVATTRGRAKFIRRIAGDRQCVTPAITNAKQHRNFAIAACIHTDSRHPSLLHTPVTSTVTVASWYHQAGSDHNITFGDGWHSVSVRAYLYVDGNSEGGRHILFNSSTDSEHAFYVQELVMYAAMEWACNTGPSRPELTRNCEELVNEYSLISRSTKPKEIVLWRGKTKDVNELVDGVVSTFQVSLPLPYKAINSGLRALFTSAVMFEVVGRGSYTRLVDDGKEDGIQELITEEGRIAGIWLMCLMLVSLSVLLLILRVKLRPTTLGEVAIARTRQDEEIVVDEWEEQERELVREQNKKSDEGLSICSDRSMCFEIYEPGQQAGSCEDCKKMPGKR